MLPEPTTTEWVAAGAAALLVVALAGMHLVRPFVGSATTAAARVAGWLLGCLTAAMVLVAVVIVGAGIRAAQISVQDLQDGTGLPSGVFARYLFDADPDSTERVAQYGSAVLLPLAGTLAVLALAAVDVGRSVGLRVVAVGTCVVLAAVSALVGLGDAGPLATRAAVAVAALALAAVAALALDLVHTRERSGGSGR